MTETDVLIIGGGPVGLAMAIELCHQGIKCILVEKSDGIIFHPKVGTIGPRTMEFCRRWGIADQVRDAGWPVEHPLDVAWVTSLGGHEILRLPFPSYSERSLPRYTPESESVCPQHWFNPLLVKHARQFPNGSIQFCCHLEHFQETDDRVIAQVKHLGDGSHSPTRKACAIKSPICYPTRIFQNILFEAPHLSAQLGSRRALVYMLVTPTLRYPLRSMDGRGLYRITVGLGVDGLPWDPETAIQEALAFETPFYVRSSVQWHLTHQVAEHFRHGRIFFAGDSAHVLSPSGGFGMNTGFADAMDLAWKLTATLKGWAGIGLLDTYETERRPIAVRSLEEANVNLNRTLGRSLSPLLLSDSHEGEECRKQMAERMKNEGVEREFNAPGIHLGMRYESSAIVADDNDSPPNCDPHLWSQNSYPGCRAPHAWLDPKTMSTLDLFGQGFVLLCFRGQDGIESLEKSFMRRNAPFRSIEINIPEISQLYEYNYVLVRPDGHVAWRGNSIPSSAMDIVDRVCGYV
jgi:flavin-dependent monooxygenase StaC